jgi:predicted transcriptional regulator
MPTGGYSGEKYSQQLKPRLRRGMILNWHVNVLKDVLKEDALSRIELPSGQPGMKILTIRDSTHVKYKTTFNVITMYNPRQPISIIHFSDTWACGIGNKDQYLEITINGSKKNAMGLSHLIIMQGPTMNVTVSITAYYYLN